MWKSIRANNSEFSELLPIIESFATDTHKISAIKISGRRILVIARINSDGIHEIAFAPETFEVFSYISPEFDEYEVSEIKQPDNIGTVNGFGRMLGDVDYYNEFISK